MSSEKLFNEVVNSGLCCSCGTCVSACPKDGLAIPLGEVGPESVSSDCTDECTICYDVCTGRDLPYSEMEEMIFGRKRTHDQVELRGLDVTSLWPGFMPRPPRPCGFTTRTGRTWRAT